jgi:hypothetical protein
VHVPEVMDPHVDRQAGLPHSWPPDALPEPAGRDVPSESRARRPRGSSLPLARRSARYRQ